MAENTKYLDLDSFDAGLPDVIIKLGGKEHKLKYASVEDFIANTKSFQTLKIDATIEDEINLIVGALVRAFPTMTKEDFLKLDLIKLQAILDFARENNGEKKISNEIKKEEENLNAGNFPAKP